MRIALILTQDLESPNGLGRSFPIAKELVQSGHQVTILALHSDFASLEPNELSFLQEGVHIKYVAQMHVQKVGSHKYYFKPLRLIWVTAVATAELIRAALSTKVDVYHVGKPHPMNGIAGLVASRLRRKPFYVDYDDLEETINRFGGRWQKKIVSFFERALPRLADGTTTHTEYTFQRLVDLGIPPGRIVYVPNGVDRSRFSNIDQETVEEMRQQLDLENRDVILYLGSMSLSSHPVDLLLSAFAIVQEAIPDVALLMVGGGENYDEICLLADKLGISDATRFTGRVAPDRVPYYYELANVSVDPIHDDITAQARFPLKIAESLAMCTPVVTSNVGDRASALKDAGVLVKPGDSRALAEGLLAVLQDQDMAFKLECAAREQRENLFWDVLVSDFLKVYEPL